MPMRRAVLAAVLALAAPAAFPDVAVDHAGVQCVVADRYPRLEASVPAGAAIARARVYFRPEAAPGWYVVDMKRAGTTLTGVLPRPQKSLQAFRYYIEVTDAAFAAARTPEFAPVVVGSAASCADKVVAATETSATVLLTPPGGAPPIPIGFAPSGVTAAATGSAAAGAASAGGGGIGTTALVVGGVAVAAGAAAVAVGSGGGDGDGNRDGNGDGNAGGGGSGGGGGGGGGTTPGGGGGPTPPTVYNIAFLPAPPGMDVSACAGRSLQWSSQAASAGADGVIDTTWAPNEPNTMRVTGRVTAAGFEATLACVSGGAPGSISAAASGAGYRGSWNFRGQSGTVDITR